MMINPVGNNVNLLSDGSNRLNRNEEVSYKSFADLIKEKIGDVNHLQVEADKIARDFALGKVDDIHDVTIATEKAQLALKLTLAIQSKVVSAYKEIMRMQI
ncbi:flagellar hook-basal body complex protein FliE [Halothermothrix orenii]|uniref:Flagellar hook-basal body complex protein FliE n=1 Tax=Halothermothrix orenii (strain H 168 / OCM 544 / DSM 9562) TaxID=373903 RepID=B8CYS0_HALOH|nr:flagellar hook-basal body complex protein FliE [Halothermothrix orenii]ACL70439.1 flagellar hook-basal body complex subunit FliE [Halothermothrix orenii H 168]